MDLVSSYQLITTNLVKYRDFFPEALLQPHEEGNADWPDRPPSLRLGDLITYHEAFNALQRGHYDEASAKLLQHMRVCGRPGGGGNLFPLIRTG